MKDEEPNFVKPFKSIYVHKKIMKEEVQQWLNDDIIRPNLSDSEFNSPIFLVPKRTGADGVKRYRFVVDFRFLNRRCVGQLLLLPEIHSILENLGTFKIPIKEEDCKKTAFSLSFRNTNSPNHLLAFLGAPRLSKSL